LDILVRQFCDGQECPSYANEAHGWQQGFLLEVLPSFLNDLLGCDALLCGEFVDNRLAPCRFNRAAMDIV